jgi:site-specific recombinase XerD
MQSLRVAPLPADGPGRAQVGQKWAGTFRGVAKRAGVERREVSLHTLRHTFASLLLQEGADLVSIQELLAHSDLSTMAVYLHLDAAHLQGAVGRHPLSG